MLNVQNTALILCRIRKGPRALHSSLEVVSCNKTAAGDGGNMLHTSPARDTSCLASITTQQLYWSAGLLCLQPAAQGGLSSWCSSISLHNAMLQTDPDLVRVLYEPFCVDRKGEIPAGKLSYCKMPVFHNYQARVLPDMR